VLRFERELLDYLGRNTEVLNTIRDTNVLDDDTRKALEAAVDKFSEGFLTGEGRALNAAGKEQFNEIEPEDIAQEQITKQKR